MHDRLQAGIEAGADIVFAAGMPADQIEIAMQRTGKPIMRRPLAGSRTAEEGQHHACERPRSGTGLGPDLRAVEGGEGDGSFAADTFPALPADVRRKMLDSDAVEARVRKYNVFEGR